MPLIIFNGRHIYEWTAAEENSEITDIVYVATKKGWMETEVFNNYFSKNLLSNFKE